MVSRYAIEILVRRQKKKSWLGNRRHRKLLKNKTAHEAFFVFRAILRSQSAKKRMLCNFTLSDNQQSLRIGKWKNGRLMSFESCETATGLSKVACTMTSRVLNLQDKFLRLHMHIAKMSYILFFLLAHYCRLIIATEGANCSNYSCDLRLIMRCIKWNFILKSLLHQGEVQRLNAIVWWNFLEFLRWLTMYMKHEDMQRQRRGCDFGKFPNYLLVFLHTCLLKA